MYSIDMKNFSIDEFSKILHSIDLLPGRKIHLNNLSQIISHLKKQGIQSLLDLQNLLKNKNEYKLLAKQLSVDEEYLAILNREVNSYESKPMNLEKINILTVKELKSLKDLGIRSTKELFEKCVNPRSRKKIIQVSNVNEEKILNALQIADLLRINGVGVVYAQILIEMGIKSINDYSKMKSEDILRKYQKVNHVKSLSKANLGIKDIEYCKRFCKKLDKEIEW
ncbi:MAG: DUF4332 domain-containing protein [Ignavibacteriales bacterium]|nr:DUF4332 domain-containing protein [Ignavibacteriales bacterium]